MWNLVLPFKSKSKANILSVGCLCIFSAFIGAQSANAEELFTPPAQASQQNTTVTQTILKSASDLSQFGEDSPYKHYFKKDESLVWQLSLPSQIGEAEPLGILVYISPSPSGFIPEEWKPLLAEKKLMWISADRAGNNVEAQRRVLQALFAVHLASQYHHVNKNRIYIAGFSGGGRVASMMAPLYPALFRGGVFMGGANELSFTKKEFESMKSNRYTFINGDADFNLAESKRVFKKLKSSGIEQVAFFEVPHLAHQPPPAATLASAVDFLDGK